MLQFEKYIEVAYDIANRSYPPYFQVHFIVVNINNADLSDIKFSVKKENIRKQKARQRSKEKTRKRVSELRANIVGTPKYDYNKECDKGEYHKSDVEYLAALFMIKLRRKKDKNLYIK